MKQVLSIDVGGTNVKFLATGQTESRRFPSGPMLTPSQMAEQILEATKDWEYEVVSIGYPGPVVYGKPLLEPRNLGRGWVGFDFAARLGKPTRVINDAAMQALGSYDGGRMLFLGLGTGLGTTLIIDKVIAPMELAHLPYRKGHTFEDYVGSRGLEKLGKKKWQRAVHDVTTRLKAALVADYVVLGGGNSKKLDELPPGARLGNNANAFTGGFRLWHDYE
ncbi:MAG: ROK family protein [Planctomycetes bacterium]|nr:ROK family protein [Planctomycetota bacterium]